MGAAASPQISIARQLPPDLDIGLALPLGYGAAASAWPSIAIALHLHYPELAPEFRATLEAAFPGPADLFITTDTADKRDRIARDFAGWRHGRVELRVTPNRGRDVAPRLVGLADVHARYELCLHLHSKRSLHWHRGDAWRRDMVDILAGSPAAILGIVEAFRRWPRLGLVMPRVFPEIRPAMNWGYDLDRCTALGKQLGVTIAGDQLLTFPAGSMYWSRGKALEPLLDLRISTEDFEPEDEAGLAHGSLAHAIERLMLHICERAGFHWLQVGPADTPAPATMSPAASPAELDDVIGRCCLRLTDPDLNPPPGGGPAAGLRVRPMPERHAPLRLTLLLDAETRVTHALLAPLRATTAQAERRGRPRPVLRLAVAGNAEPLPSHLDLAGIEIVRLPQDDLAPPLRLGPRDALLAPTGAATDAALRLAQACGGILGTAPAVWALSTDDPTPRRAGGSKSRYGLKAIAALEFAMWRRAWLATPAKELP